MEKQLEKLASEKHDCDNCKKREKLGIQTSEHISEQPKKKGVSFGEEPAVEIQSEWKE